MQLINCTFVYLVPFFVKFGVGCICNIELGLINKYPLNYQYPGKITLLLLFVLLVHWCFFLFQEDVAHFSFPFEFEMFYKDESYLEEHKGDYNIDIHK